jgi:hypothetical protein
VYLPAQHRYLMAQDQEFDVFGSAVTGEWVNICSTWRISGGVQEPV